MVTLKRAGRADRDWIIAAHAAHYTSIEGFDASFAPRVAEGFDAYLATADAPDTGGWIAWDATGRAGSILCVPSPAPGVAQLRLFLVLDRLRGQGVGRRLLARCRDFAGAAGYKRLRLWTHAEHRAARALYADQGFLREDAYPVRSFGRALTEEIWSLPLAIEKGLG